MIDYQRLVDFFMDEIPEDSPFEGKIKYLVGKLIAEGVTFQKWIPVTERLPEALEENKGKKIIPCLVAYTPYGNGRLVTQFRQRRFSEDYGWYWPKMGSCNITHWMLLPEPPKEE